MINPFNPQQHGIIMYSNGNNIHHRPVCCAVIPSSFGVPLVLTSWIVGKKRSSQFIMLFVLWHRRWLTYSGFQGISLYFSSLAFMGKNRKSCYGSIWRYSILTRNLLAFYSHFEKAAIIVFGVLNVIFVIVCCFGYSLHLVITIRNHYIYNDFNLTSWQSTK